MDSFKDLAAEKVIEILGLEPLPKEGGYFKQVFKHAKTSENESGVRSLGTHIFYLITPDSFSALHKVKSIEIFHFYAGDPVEMLQITDGGDCSLHELGQDFLAGETPVVTVPENTWQGTRLKDGGKWALLGCTVIPGFEYDDYTHGERAQLLEKFSQQGNLVQKYTVKK